MGRWASRRRTQSLLIAAILLAGIGAELRWPDPMPRLAAARRRSRPDAAETSRLPSSSAERELAFNFPAAGTGLIGGEPLPEEDMRDAVAAPLPALRSMLWEQAPARGAQRDVRVLTPEPFRAGQAPQASSSGDSASRIAQKKSEPRAEAIPDRREPPLRAGSADFFPNPSWHAWSRRGEPPPLAQKLRDEARRLRAERQSPSRSVPQDSRIPGGRGGDSHRSHSAASASGKEREKDGPEKEKTAGRPRPPKFRPILLSKLLGARPLRPPEGISGPPPENPWSRPIPERLGDGTPIEPSGFPLPAVEKIPPPGEAASCREKDAHWHVEGAVHFFHEGPAWGRWEAERWAWLERSRGRWWIWGRREEPALLWHEDHWWWKARGVWFLLHQGEPWGYRHFADLNQEGFIHPGSGTQMVYSADASRVRLISPGEGEAFFDAASGRELGRVSEERRPRRPPPRGSPTLDELKNRPAKWYP